MRNGSASGGGDGSVQWRKQCSYLHQSLMMTGGDGGCDGDDRGDGGVKTSSRPCQAPYGAWGHCAWSWPRPS